ncbi:DUF2029 domain-containing protein [Actinotalea ferrariae]|uniref:glycosyltransferase 87 family protein n=1 Tax=Actinotalea ferrariae TaxID=1386098 RepID=UPI001C8C2703|nr:glycosyltransferase 87 family protein [Actinotalea ferrariae]MBX9245868.1 DUF2029 domain-containing protein [Actinotalea ferrariae]
MSQALQELDWVSREMAALDARRPALARALRWTWRHPTAVLVTLAVVVPGLLGANIPGGDAAWFRRAGLSMLGPDFWQVFVEPGLQVGPLYLLFLGCLTWVVGALGLPVLFTVAAVQCGLLTWLAVGTARRAARAAGVAGRRGAAVPWAVGLPVVLGGPLAEAVGNGHPEEILVGLVLVEAALLAAAGRRVLPGVLVGVAAGVKLWGVLGAPLLLLGRRLPDVVARCAAAALVVLACYVPFFLLGEVNTFEFRWGVSAGSTLALLGSWVPASGWVARVVQGLAAGLAGSAVALHRRSTPLAAVVVVVSVRLLLDPLRLTYYSGPLIVVVLLWLWTSAPVSSRSRLVLTLLTPAVVLVPYFLPAMVNGVISTLVLVAVPVGVVLLERRTVSRTR